MNVSIISFCVGTISPDVSVISFYAGTISPDVSTIFFCVGMISPDVSVIFFCVGTISPDVSAIFFCVGTISPDVSAIFFCVGMISLNVSTILLDVRTWSEIEKGDCIPGGRGVAPGMQSPAGRPNNQFQHGRPAGRPYSFQHQTKNLHISQNSNIINHFLSKAFGGPGNPFSKGTAYPQVPWSPKALFNNLYL